MRKIVVSAMVVAAVLGGALLVIKERWPVSQQPSLPDLVPVPDLPAVTRSSLIIAPIVVARSAIRNALDAQAPRQLTGQQVNPLPQFLTAAEVSWSVDRSPLAVTAQEDELTISTELNGGVHIAGAISEITDDLVGTLGGLLNPGLGQALRQLTGQVIDQTVEFRGNVRVVSRPSITADWRLQPNLTNTVSISEASLLIAGVPLELGKQLQPMLAHTLADQTTEFQSWLGNDAFIEQAARRAWTKICRAIPLSAVAPDLPTLWLEVRPTRAFAAKPRIRANDVVLMLGIEVETRIIPDETTPACPFPARLDVVPQTENGRISIATPIDIPFTDINRLLRARLNGKTFPEAGGPFAITVQQVALAASGDRVLVSLHVRARENESWFGLGAEADINLWGRPVLDGEHQVLRFSDLELDIQSRTAFGLLGKAAHAGLPLLQDVLRREAVIDLKPFVADARSHLADAVHDFSRQEPGVRVDAAIDDLRLVSIAFDSKMLRVTAEANGRVQVRVSSLAF